MRTGTAHHRRETQQVFVKILVIAIAGGLGALARYGLGGLVQRVAGAEFPWGTIVVNVLGCLLFGLVWSLAEERVVMRPELRPMILVGFMGAFTTFSTYLFEISAMLRDAQWVAASANFMIQNIAGLAAILLGMALGRLI